MSAQPQLDLGIQTPRPRRGKRLEHPDGGQFPGWIREQLKTNKKKPAPRGRTEHHYCRDCDQIVITGTYDLGPRPGRSFINLTADPTPLDPNTELACILTGRHTYRARTTPSSIQIIDGRSARWEYTWHAHEIVLPAHQCGARFDGFHTPPTQPARSLTNDPDGIPF